MTQPIAYADPSGFVIPAPTTSDFSAQAKEQLLTPLYTSQEVEEAKARFYVNQGLNPDGSDPAVESAATVVEAATQAAEADRIARNNGQAATGESVADAAQEALAALAPVRKG